jgi:tellurite resistance protein TerC
MLSPKGKAKAAVANARRYATDYLNLESSAERAEREKIYARIEKSERQLAAIEPRHRALVREPADLRELLDQAHAQHRAAVP